VVTLFSEDGLFHEKVPALPIPANPSFAESDKTVTETDDVLAAVEEGACALTFTTLVKSEPGIVTNVKQLMSKLTMTTDSNQNILMVLKLKKLLKRQCLLPMMKTKMSKK
jgi:hypothetical protein